MDSVFLLHINDGVREVFGKHEKAVEYVHKIYTLQEKDHKDLSEGMMIEVTTPQGLAMIKINERPVR